MFVTLMNLQTNKTNDVNTDHIVSVWSEEDCTGLWEITHCKDINGVEYEIHIPKDSFLRRIGKNNEI